MRPRCRRRLFRTCGSRSCSSCRCRSSVAFASEDFHRTASAVVCRSWMATFGRSSTTPAVTSRSISPSHRSWRVGSSRHGPTSCPCGTGITPLWRRGSAPRRSSGKRWASNQVPPTAPSPARIAVLRCSSGSSSKARCQRWNRSLPSKSHCRTISTPAVGAAWLANVASRPPAWCPLHCSRRLPGSGMG